MTDFLDISRTESKFKFNNQVYILVEEDYYYGQDQHKAINLYSLDGFFKNFIKNIGCTDSDEIAKKDSKFYLENICNRDQCKKAAVEYLDKLIN